MVDISIVNGLINHRSMGDLQDPIDGGTLVPYQVPEMAIDDMMVLNIYDECRKP